MDAVGIMLIILYVLLLFFLGVLSAFDKGFHKGFKEGQKSIKNKGRKKI